jgi:hypothetical protein
MPEAVSIAVGVRRRASSQAHRDCLQRAQRRRRQDAVQALHERGE